MCGIAGLFHKSASREDDLRSHVRRMTDVLRNRGPDDDGEWVDSDGSVALGFRRLAILDLSPTGAQPMTSPSGRLTMVFNGEVYNFRALRDELRARGISFRGGSDSEVVLAAFDEWGIEETLPRLIGMFGIALWDRELQELVLIRDVMGIKPLYVAQTARGVAFASELGALTEAPGFDATLDSQATLAFLRYLYVPAPRTPVRSVRKLEPGHMLRIPRGALNSGIPESTPFWSIADARRRGTESRGRASAASSPTEAAAKVDELDALVADAVRLRMVADVPVGALLSGGLDSSLVVSMMQREASQPVRTFTIGFDQAEHDESGPARAIARHLGTKHSELMVSDSDALEVVPQLPEIFDEPLADPSQIPTYLVSKLARQQVTVALSGDGGDELFGGYTRYTVGRSMIPRIARVPGVPRRWLGSAIRSIQPSAWARVSGLLPDQLSGTRLVGQKALKLGRMFGAPSAGEMYRTLLSTSDSPQQLLREESNGWDPIRDQLAREPAAMSLDQMLAVDQRYYLPDDLLQKVDRASMAASLEARVPLLDQRLVEFSWTLRDDLKIRGGEGKWLLRQVLYRNVPRELLDRPKTGFSVPIAAWFRGSLREWSEHTLLGGSPVRDAIFCPDEIRTAWRGLLAGRDEAALSLWAILMFEAWRERWKMDDLSASSEPL